MAKSTRRSRQRKPAKPRRDFPLFPHASGRWAKKVRGKFCYFGKVADDPKGEAALERWLDQKDDLLAGRTPSSGAETLTVADLCNHFLTAKKRQLDPGEITPRTFHVEGLHGRGRLRNTAGAAACSTEADRQPVLCPNSWIHAARSETRRWRGR